MTVSTLAVASTFMFVHVPTEKASTYSAKYLALLHSKSSISRMPKILQAYTNDEAEANWHTVNSAGSGRCTTANLLTMSIEPEHMQ